MSKIATGSIVTLKGDREPRRQWKVMSVGHDLRGNLEALIQLHGSTWDSRTKVVPVADLAPAPVDLEEFG